MRKVLLFLLLFPFAAFGQKVIPMVKPMVSFSMAGAGGTSNSGIGYFYAPDGWEIGNEIWTITDIVRDADSLDITVNDTAFYRLIGDSSQSFTDRTIVNAPSLLTNAPYGFAIHTDTTKTQSIIEDTDTLNINSGGWLFEIKPPPPPPDALTTFTVSAHERDTAITNAIGFDATADSFRLNYVTGLTAPATRTANTVVLASSDTAAFKNLKIPIDVPDDNTNYAFALWSGRANSWTSNTDTVQLDSIVTGSTLLDGIVSYWNCDEASGSVLDATENNHDGTVTNATQNQSGAVLGKCIDFDGDGDYVDFGDNVAFEFADSFSISVWVNSDLGSGGIIANYIGDPTYHGYKMLLYLSKANFFAYVTGDNIDVGGGTNIIDTDWHHVVITFDSEHVNLYVDGSTDMAEEDYTNTLDYPAGSHLRLGGDNTDQDYDGQIDEVGIWNRALTSSEITELYNSGTGLTYPFE
jgi:hypothetical protein